MDDYEEFSQALSRTGTNNRSSLLEESNGGRRMSQDGSMPSHNRSLRQQRNFEIYEDPPGPAPRRMPFQIYEDSPPEGKRRPFQPITIKPGFMIFEDTIDPEDNPRPMSGRTDGRQPFQPIPRRQSHERPFEDIPEAVSREARRPFQPIPSPSPAGRNSFQRSEPHYGNQAQDSLELSNTSHHMSGRALNLSNFGVHGVQSPANQLNLSGRPFAFDRTPAIRITSDSHSSGRPFNLSDFNRGRTPRQQDTFNSSGQIGGQYLQIPRERFGQSGQASTGNLSRSLQVPSERFGQSELSQCPMLSDMRSLTSGICYRDVPQSTMICPSSAPRQSPCSQQNVCPIQSECGEGAGESCPQKPKTRMCPNILQEQMVQFLQTGDLCQICRTASTVLRSPLFDTLVKDKYYPGAIEDTVNGNFDFNRVVFDAVFDCENIPSKIEIDDVPMTLLEAFDLRIQYERDLLETFKGRKEACAKQKNELEMQTKAGHKPSEHTDGTPFWIHRDELKLASTIDIDLSSNIRDQPDTELTKAIVCLFKAEKMNNFDKYVHLAENAIRCVPPELSEKAQCSFQIEDVEVEQEQVFKPIEIVSYIGTTKPAETIQISKMQSNF